MATIPLPFVDGESMSTDNPTGALMTFVVLVVGFAALFYARDLGFSLKNSVAQITGVGASGNNDQNTVELI